jgi:hypothetical protein
MCSYPEVSPQHVENYTRVTRITLAVVPESKRRKPKSKPLPASAAASSAKSKQPSPTWYVAIMAGLMAVGVLLVLSRFVFELDRLVLIGGLACIAIGFLMTTNYR